MSFCNPYLDWGEHGGLCCECWEVQPCCGKPCSFLDGLYCCICWYCCFMCSVSKLFATSLGEKQCRIVNHCLLWWVAAWCPCTLCCMKTSLRVNLRRMHKIGSKDCSCCDCFLTCCGFTAPCALCQECRSVEPSQWDWLDQFARDRTFHKTLNGECDVCYGSQCLICRDDSAENETVDDNPYALMSQEELDQLHQQSEKGAKVLLIVTIIVFILIFLSPFTFLGFFALAVVFYVLAICCLIIGSVFAYFVLPLIICYLLALVFLLLAFVCFIMVFVSLAVFTYTLPVFCVVVFFVCITLLLYVRRVNFYVTRAGGGARGGAGGDADQSDWSSGRANEAKEPKEENAEADSTWGVTA